MPGGHGVHDGKPGPLQDPAEHGEQLGAAAPAAHDQLGSKLRAKEAPAPAEPAAHEKAYELAPSTGVAGVTAVLGKVASGGCESASTSVAESARL